MTKYTIEVTHYEDGVFVFIRDLDLNIAENDRVAIEAALKEALRIVRKQTAQRFQYERSAVMKQPHKHAEVLRAIADGKEVQFKNQISGAWVETNHVNLNPITHPELEWRVKPEPKPDVVLYSIAHPLTTNNLGNVSNAYPLPERWEPNLRLTFDGDTCKLKNAEVLE